MSSKETRAVLDFLEDQGAKVEPTNSGHRVLFPDGSTTAIHWTTTDWRVSRNLKRGAKRAGIEWPFDEPEKVDVRRARTEAQIAAAVDRLGSNFTTAELVAESRTSQPSVARYLREHRFTASRCPVNRRVWIWAAPQGDADMLPGMDYPDASSDRRDPGLEIDEDHSGRVFFDSVDSWTIPVPNELAELAAAMRMHVEVRVWRMEDVDA